MKNAKCIMKNENVTRRGQVKSAKWILKNETEMVARRGVAGRGG